MVIRTTDTKIRYLAAVPYDASLYTELPIEACNATCAAGQCDSDEQCMGFTLITQEHGKEPVAILTSEVKSGTFGTGLECYRKLFPKECSANVPKIDPPNFPKRPNLTALTIDRQYCKCTTRYEDDWEDNYPYICGSNSGVYDASGGIGLSILDFVKLIPVVGEVVSIGDAVANLIKGIGSVGENVVDILLNTFTLTLSATTMGLSAPTASSLRASVVSNKISMLTKISGQMRKVSRDFLDFKVHGVPVEDALNTMGDLKSHSDWLRTYAKGFSSIAVEGLNGCGALLPTFTEISSDKWKNLNYAGWMEGVWTADFVMQRYRDPKDNLTYNDIQTQVDQAIFYYIDAARSKKRLRISCNCQQCHAWC